MTGCSLAACTETAGQSDGMLLLLDQMIPEHYDVYYNGWDHRDIAPASGAGLHHPEGDYMKISTYGSPATITTFESAEFKGDKNAHLNVTFMQTVNGFGVTEEGSSGSPLFNENKLVTATLTGGNSSCTYSKGLNLYGRLYSHWDKYGADSVSRMSVWLDPLETGAETLTGRYRREIKPAPADLRAVNQGQVIYLSWKAPAGNTNIEKYNIYRNNQKLAETVGWSYLDHEAVDGQNTYSLSAVYSDGEESPFVTTSISFTRYKPPTGLQAVRKTLSKVKISWAPPIYEQTIYWGSLNMTHETGFDDNRPFYFGQKWQGNELTLLHLNLINAIQFIPVYGNTYQVYIMQGERQYRQDIENSALVYEDLNTVNLNEPFVIDASQDLTVAIYVSIVGSDYPAVCDYGSAIDGKGNIFSEDGVTWYSLYDGNNPHEFDYNFIVAAVVSSRKGTVTPAQSSVVRTGKTVSRNNTLKPRSILKKPLLAAASLQSSAPMPFPQVTRYKIYRMGSSYLTLDAEETSYMETTSSNHYTYEVTAFYGETESVKSNLAGISTVAVENINDSVDIFPSAFSKNVYFRGFEYSTRLEIISANGKICMRLDNAGQTIDVSSLTPGIYFFRIYGDNNKILKTVKTIKVN
jgi:hypothetical protein